MTKKPVLVSRIVYSDESLASVDVSERCMFIQRGSDSNERFSKRKKYLDILYVIW